MIKGKAFILVGHESWGKSKTLESLTGGNHRVRRINIKGRELFIRRMSNDDKPISLLRFVREIDPRHRAYVVLTLCPNLHNPLRKTVEILAELAKKYELFFWVLKFKYATNETVSDDEIERLEQYGAVEIFVNRKAQSKERAREFRDFIEKWL